MIEFISNDKNKRKIAFHILDNLPQWFGMPESTQNYIDECVAMPFWTAVNEVGEPIGFICLKENSEYTAEIYVMGVLKEYHRKGIGKELFCALYEFCKTEGYEFLQVKTVDAGYYKEYDSTRMFYEKMGFKKFEVFPTLWDKHNPCLVLVLHVN